ncbi:unnamed protein product [Didymodactylos carnosus]|uniref:Uncharacterized protein n=1 Tax=Didymodactylos carnosus TaxID=1234261 RepID=A0A8S2EQ98_9BILA|nr:unnamed protein product [Didymodactylos carnosus]CAF4032953.1 unnamed protein product [Didymodactylos carnosus]
MADLRRYVEPNYSKPQNLMAQPCSNVYGNAMRLMHNDSNYELLDHGYGNYGQDGFNVNMNNYRNGFQSNFSQMNDVRYYCNHGGYNTNGFDNMNQIPDPNVRNKRLKEYNSSRDLSVSQQMYDSNVYSQQQNGNMSIDNYIDMERRDTNEAQLSNITDQAINYANSRYEFSPFVIKFENKVSESKVINDLCEHINKYCGGFDLKLAGFRFSFKEPNCGLVFVKDRYSFGVLYNENNWPKELGGSRIGMETKPSIPPQLALVLRNVGLDHNVNDLLTEIQEEYPDIVDAYRMKSKNGEATRLVKISVNNGKLYDDLLTL